MSLAGLLDFHPLSITSPTSHKQIMPFQVLIPRWRACVHSRILWVSPTDSPVRLGVSPTATTPTDFYSQRFEALFPCTGTLGCTVWLTLQLFLQVYPPLYMGNPIHQPPPHLSQSSATLPQVLSTWLPVSTPPTSLDECLFYNSLAVGLLSILIFWQFWLFFVFQLVVILLLVVWGSETFLPVTESWLEPNFNF